MRQRDLKDGRRLTTVSLTNVIASDQTEGIRSEDCLLQCALEVRPLDGAVLPYRLLGDLVPDEEEEELALRYRDRPVFAVGHGVAAAWELDDSGACTIVRSDPLPEHLVPTSTSAVLDSRSLELRFLEGIDREPAPILEELTGFVDAYETWIDTASKSGEETAAIGAASRIVERQRTAVQRMRTALDLLGRADGDGTTARTALSLAMRAMRAQMTRPAAHGRDAEPRWRPFQLGFILTALASVFDPDDPQRGTVDLIWFPTGGGKTEAYLALAAFEIFRRRLVLGERGEGTAVITRYTLRLLTAQQFERACALVCAMDALRGEDDRVPREWTFSIGLWIGRASTPNTNEEARARLKEMKKERTPENRFQLSRCPWCGTPLIPGRDRGGAPSWGIIERGGAVVFACPSEECRFHSRLPVAVVDEQLYADPPTILLSTVDKFAQIAFRRDAGAFLGADSSCAPPSLIIQDELHLLSGPLGSVVGAYETAFEGIIRANAAKPPKIIASTATIRAAQDQIRSLYGRPSALFPPSGLSADDSFFSAPDPDASPRTYLGLMPYSFTQARAIVLTIAAMLMSPESLPQSDPASLDAYWTVVAYHNSLRELGRTIAYVNDDVRAHLESAGSGRAEGRALNVVELTGQVSSHELTRHFDRLRLDRSNPEAVDVVVSTNMLSVGIDIDRLSLMLMVGQPKTTSEYIQATSRVGRGDAPGVILTLFKPSRPRDRSHYESFHGFHESLYRYVEPTSVTPWTEGTRRRSLAAVLVSLIRHTSPWSGDREAGDVNLDSAVVEEALRFILDRAHRSDPEEADDVASALEALIEDWRARQAEAGSPEPNLRYGGDGSKESKTAGLLRTDAREQDDPWFAMNSMRAVEPEVTFVVDEISSFWRRR